MIENYGLYEDLQILEDRHESSAGDDDENESDL